MFDPTKSQQFALDLVRACYQNGRNLCVCPYGVKTSLSMVINGAKGRTLQQLVSTLGYPTTDLGAINQHCQQLADALKVSSSDGMMIIANALWLSTIDRASPAYIKRVKSEYRAEVNTVNFADRTVADRVNRWVKDKTQGRITKINTRINPKNTAALLTNIVDFLGIWQYPFDPQDTTPQQWTDVNGRTSKVMTMSRIKRDVLFYPYRDICAIQMPYRQTDWNMTLMMPLNMYIQQFVNKMTAEKLKDVNSKFIHDLSSIYVPRFELSSELDLIPPLKSLGMTDPFSPNADLSGMFANKRKDCCLSPVMQQCRLTCNEKGTSATAFTLDGVLKGELDQLRFNKPFMYVIQHNVTGEVVFAGVVCNPNTTS